jgi:predicted metalloprotease with PDZ domain
VPITLPVTSYRIAARDPHAHLFEVSCTVDAPASGGQRFRLPSWIPGSYLIREFARHFVSVHAHCDGRPVGIVKESKDTWRADPCAGPLTVTADVYAYDLSVRAAYLDGTRAYFNGTSVFLCPEGREAAPCRVEIVAPEGRSGWRVATTLAADGAAPWGFGFYRAADYDELIDHPVEISDFAHVAFEAGGAVHDVVISGRHDADLDRLATDLARICRFQIELFDGPGARAPFDRYLFQVLALGDGYGGLEHRASTSLVCARRDLPRRGVAKITDEYRTLLGLASHEYFHAWNVKRIKPAAFVPYDLAREGYTRQLWAFEGFTSYYDDLALVRSDTIDAESYLELLGRTITNVLRTPGRRVQSVAESSFDAWIKYYRQDENTPNAVVSYYAKGALVGLALDLLLRREGAALDDVMRALWQRHGRTGIGVPESAIAAIASEVAGRDLGDFFARHVDGTEDPPLAELLDSVGVKMKLRAAEGPNDRGGTPGSAPDGAPPRVALGAKLAASGEARLLHVFRDGPAARAGLSGGDVIVAIDGLRASAEGVGQLLARRTPGERVVVHAFRRDELMAFEVALEAAPQDTCHLAFASDAPADALERRRGWLGKAATGR